MEKISDFPMVTEQDCTYMNHIESSHFSQSNCLVPRGPTSLPYRNTKKCLKGGEIVLNIVSWGGEWRGPKGSFQLPSSKAKQVRPCQPLGPLISTSRPTPSSETLEFINAGQTHTEMRWLLDLKVSNMPLCNRCSPEF